MNFRSINDLTRCLEHHMEKFRGFDLIVAVPRSGLLAGTLLSLMIHKPVLDLAGFAVGRKAVGGRRLGGKEGGLGRVLVLDDSVTTGAALADARKLLGDREGDLTFACVYVVPEAEHLVDLYCEVIPHPRVFEQPPFPRPPVRHNGSFSGLPQKANS